MFLTLPHPPACDADNNTLKISNNSTWFYLFYHLFFSRICQQLAELYANSRDWNKAIELFKEAIGHNERDTKVIIINKYFFFLNLFF